MSKEIQALGVDTKVWRVSAFMSHRVEERIYPWRSSISEAFEDVEKVKRLRPAKVEIEEGVVDMKSNGDMKVTQVKNVEL